MRRQDYTVGWICALELELPLARALLDEKHDECIPPTIDHPRDNNVYTLGRIGDHNIVIASLPLGRDVDTSAASMANDMLRSFESIRFGLMVGIGGGAPSDKNDIRLGDIVVGYPGKKEGGVISYHSDKAILDKKLVRTGTLNPPPPILLTALDRLSAHHERNGVDVAKSLYTLFTRNPELQEKYQYPNGVNDRLYKSSYVHRSGSDTCENACSSASPPLLQRSRRWLTPNEPKVHYGIIASGDTVMRDAAARDRLTKEYNILCYEMEAVGLTNDFPCVVIRGVCDYADSHKNGAWHGYAAATAASFTKELLCILSGNEVSHAQMALAMNTMGE